MRGEVLRVALLIVSLPLTLSSIYIVGSSAVVHELSSTPLTVLQPVQSGLTCVRAGVVYSQVQGIGVVPVYLVERLDSFLSLYGCRATYVRGGVGGALLSVELWRSLPVGVVQLSMPHGVNNASVVGFVECRHLRGSFVVVNSSGGGGLLELCPRPSAQLEVVGDFGESFSNVMVLLAFLSLIPFAAVSPLALSRAVDSLSRELCVFRGQGLGLNELKQALFFSLLTVVFASSAYGVAAGVVLAHGALWALRFLGVSVFSRPLPLSQLLPPVCVYAVVVLLSALLVVDKRVGRIEGSC